MIGQLLLHLQVVHHSNQPLSTWYEEISNTAQSAYRSNFLLELLQFGLSCSHISMVISVLRRRALLDKTHQMLPNI